MTTYKVTAKGKEFTVTTENVIIQSVSDKSMEKYIGLHLIRLINVCAIKGYSFEKL